MWKCMPPQLGPIPQDGVVAFNTLRDRLLSPPVLALPRAKGQLWLDTDASDVQLGCCLLQLQPDGKPLPSGYWSRTIKSAYRKYFTTEKEYPAIVWAVTHLRPYLEGIDFTVRTDHHALRWVMNIYDAQGRLARWRLRLSKFTFKVEYHPEPPIMLLTRCHGSPIRQSRQSLSRRKYLFVRFRRRLIGLLSPAIILARLRNNLRLL
jgi:hypothetical protein